ncbi:RNA-directed DNA polymerase, eukaryota, reverse transcriptase zinc-binding domain protein [Tanacetum coccineum]
MVDGMWVDSPNKVKKEFLDHFRNRFCKPGERKATLQMEFPKQIHPDQQRELESEVTNEEIKKAEVSMPGGGVVNLSHMFYADDAVFVWLNGVEEQLFSAANKLGCLVLKTPFLYLGSFVGGAMHRLQAWNDIVDRVKRRLSKWKMKMLSIGGRLTLVKSVLGFMHIFHMSMFKVPSGILRTLESIRCQFFNGHDVSSKKASWVQWNKITSLWARGIKDMNGGDGKIGVVTRSGTKSCWMNIVNEINVLSKKDINLMNFLRIKLGNGESTLFWEDVWCEGGKLKDRFPRAYALESCKTITVGSKLVEPNLTYSLAEHDEGKPVTLSPISDRWTWTLNSSGEFSVASVRNLIDVKMFPEGDHKTRWIRYVPIKVNTHAWKVMTNSLPTRFNISRRGIDIDSITCANCDMGVETTSHLFFTCDMAQQVARLITRWWDVPDLEMDSYGSWKIWMVNLRMPSKIKDASRCVLCDVVAFMGFLK